MARFKYLSATLLALFLSLASCGNNPTPSGDPSGNPPDGGGGSNPPGETLDKALFTFSEEFQDGDGFTDPLTKGAFTMTASNGGSTNSPKYFVNGNNLRFYHGNTFTISGTKMTEINFDASYNNSGDLSVSVGEYDHSTKKWTGDATTVTFTVTETSGSTGQFRVVALAVNQAVTDDTGGGGGGSNPPAPTGEHATFDFSVIYGNMQTDTDEFSSLTGYGLTLSAVQGSGSTAPTIYKNGYQLRLYANNEFTIAGSNITRVDFTFDTTKTGTFTANSGTMGDTTWTGSTNSLVLTVASGQRRIKTMTVYADIDETDIPETGGDVPGGGGEESTHTALSVFIDIVAACTGTTMTETQAKEYADTDIGGYGIAINWGTTSEYTIETALTDALDYYIPEYLVITEEAVADYWDEEQTDPGYFSTLETSDSTVTVELGTFVDGDVYLNITVY